MKFIRIGNNVNVSWEITRYGEKEDLASKNIQVLLIDKNNHKQEFSYSITNKNKIVGTFYGKDQKCCGVYRLLLIENENTKEQAVLDYIDCFTISQKLKNTTSIGSDAGVETVDLTSNISTDAIAGYATIDYVNDEIAKLDISSYAKADSVPTKTSQLTNDSDYATTEFVQNAIAKRNIAEQDTNASVTLSPNKHVDITSGEELILTLEAPTDTSIVNLYTCTILAYIGGTLTLTDTINWGDDEPVIERNTFNEISIRAISDRDGNVSYYGIFHTWYL